MFAYKCKRLIEDFKKERLRDGSTACFRAVEPSLCFHLLSIYKIVQKCYGYGNEKIGRGEIS